MRIKDYPNNSNPDTNAVKLLIDGTAGTQTVTPKTLIDTHTNKDVLNKRTRLSGKSLGSMFTATQKTAITNGTFSGLGLGDYWTMSNGDKWYIIDFNYFKNLGYGDFAADSRNHIVVGYSNYVMTDYHVFSNDSASGGYLTSTWNTSIRNSKVSLATNFFGNDNVIEHPFIAFNKLTEPWYSNSGGIGEKLSVYTMRQIVGFTISQNVFNELGQFALPRIANKEFLGDLFATTTMTPFNSSGLVNIGVDFKPGGPSLSRGSTIYCYATIG